MSMIASRTLEHKSQLVVPNMFQELTGKSRVEFLEVSCEPDSLLTEAIRTRTGRSDSACRSALWSGQDLSTPDGLALIIEQIRCTNPKHVWIALPGEAFSSLQNLNQKNPNQVRDLKAKRALAIKYYESTEELAKICVSAGIHVTVELGEKNEVWRLPVMQRLRLHSGMYTCVTKGCAVGLKSGSGRLIQKGWRLVTTHKRLSEMLHKSCPCPTSYEHGRCSGNQAQSIPRYTPEYRRLVCEALSREGNFDEVVQECAGASRLPEGFGSGVECQCVGGQAKEVCGSCMVQGVDRDVKGPETALLSLQEQGNLEQAARSYTQQRSQPTIKDLEKLLKEHPLTNLGKSRRKQKHSSDYHVFGTYAFGNHYGITSRSRSLPELCRCVNRVIKHHLPPDMKWTSFAINSGTAMPTHRDVNNHAMYPNGSIGLGDYQGGEIWVEGLDSVGGRSGKVTNREGPQGVELTGQEFDVQGKTLVFSPKQWHGTCPWVGERWVITVFVSRGWDHLSQEEREELRSLYFPVPNLEIQEAYPAEAQASMRERRKEDERIRKKLYLLHCATGHSHPKHMIQALKRRGADERVLKLAAEFKCDVCKENQRPLPRNLAALEPLPPKLYTIGADIGHWAHPHTQMSLQFMIVVDEGSRFKAARILSSGSKQSPNAQTCLSYFQEGWVQYFGHPRALRLDPAGAFRSAAVEAWCDRHAVHLDIVPGEAHWKIGTVENAVRGIKRLMTKLSHYDTEITAQEALAEAVWALNHREIIRGYSPAQHILGQAPDETGRFLPSSTDVHPNLLVENPTQEFERAAQRRAEAEKALAEWSAKQRIMRAQHSKHRPCYLFEPGELVYYWRTQDANKGRRQPGGKHGRFLGPARILATESRKDANDQPRPGGSVWLVKGRSLLKCAPEQLRRATEREELMEALASKSGEATPWTFKAVASEIGGNRYEDISAEAPSASEWNRAQRIEDEAPPVRHRIHGKRPASQRQEPGDMIEVEEEPGPEMTAERDDRPWRERSRSRLRGQASAEPIAEQPAAWWSGVQWRSLFLKARGVAIEPSKIWVPTSWAPCGAVP